MRYRVVEINQNNKGWAPYSLVLEKDGGVWTWAMGRIEWNRSAAKTLEGFGINPQPRPDLAMRLSAILDATDGTEPLQLLELARKGRAPAQMS